jgi:hypothetical protein
MKTTYSAPGQIALTLTCAAILPAGTVVELTGDWTVNKAAAGSAKVLGELLKPVKAANDIVAVETQGRKVIEGAISAEALAAGDKLKVGADGTGSVQRLAKWVLGTDNPALIVGMALKAAGAADTAFDALLY